MTRQTLVWMLSGLAVLGVGALTVVVGRTLMPARTTAQTVGTLVPWFITWGMIWMTMVIAVIMTVNLVAIGLNSGRSHPTPGPPDREPARSTPDARRP